MKIQQIATNWTLSPTGDLSHVPADLANATIPATVPGCVHTDLLAAGLIPDPYLDRNEPLVAWIAETDWKYSCAFDANPGVPGAGHVELVFDGLDTVADVALNGTPIGHGENMHHPHVFDARDALRAKGNLLEVTFTSALTYTRGYATKYGERPNVMPDDYNYIRKMACNFGWDWGPTLTTAGMWKPVFLRAWSGARIDAVRPLVMAASSDSASVEVHADLVVDGAKGARLEAVLAAPDDAVAAKGCIDVSSLGTALTLTVTRPRLWWPKGHGDQPLYDLTVKLVSATGEKLDAWSGRIGLRTAKLNTAPDEIGSKFVIEINGKPVFCKGANWIPDDCFVSRVGAERYRARLEQAADANMNMLRIWGGGIYEKDEFYEICDELGIMVWQDFLFACAAYSEEEPFPQLVEAEARYNIARLSTHPSLVLWNGNNENVWGYFDWNWKEPLAGRTWGAGYYFDLLPKLVAELDPSRSYWGGSPYSGSMDIPPNVDEHGNKHVWDAWNQVDYDVYRKYTPRFVSEFGHQAHPTWATLARAVPPEERTADSAAMLLHQKATDGHNKLNTRLREHFDMPEDFDDWLYLTQVNQARAMVTGVEWYRSRMPVCMGTLYWQINDCWPVTSWAAIDGDGRPKPLLYATKRFYADRILTFQPEPCGTVLYAVNDSDEAWSDDVAVRRMAFDGNVLAESRHAVVVPARSVARVCLLNTDIVTPGDPARELAVADAGPVRAVHFFDVDRSLIYPAAAFTSDMIVQGDVHRLTITAESLLRDVCVFADRLDADSQVSDALVTLLPGESFTFVIRSGKSLSEKDLTSRPVFACVNPFGKA